MKKTIILFGFESCLASDRLNLRDKYLKLQFSGKRYKISKVNLHLFDDLVKRVMDNTDELSIAFWTNDLSADAIYRSVTSLDNIALPIVKLGNIGTQFETIDRMSKNVDKIVLIGAEAKQFEVDSDCQIISIPTVNELTEESWKMIVEALKA
jgi:hypothetical protein